MHKVITRVIVLGMLPWVLIFAFCQYLNWDWWSEHYKHFSPLPFDRKFWSMPRELHPDGWEVYDIWACNLFNPTRYQMLQTVLQQRVLDNKSEDEVRQFLGEPERVERWEGKDDFLYYVSTPYGHGELHFRFKEQKLIEARLILDEVVESD